MAIELSNEDDDLRNISIHSPKKLRRAVKHLMPCLSIARLAILVGNHDFKNVSYTRTP